MRPVRLGVVLLLSVVLVAWASVALADGRVALVVGNSTYAHIGRLPNPANDAAAVTAALRRLGFDVTTSLDAGLTELNQALRTFTRRSAGADVALVFYAGHGLDHSVPVALDHPRDLLDRLQATANRPPVPAPPHPDRPAPGAVVPQSRRQFLDRPRPRPRHARRAPAQRRERPALPLRHVPATRQPQVARLHQPVVALLPQGPVLRPPNLVDSRRPRKSWCFGACYGVGTSHGICWAMHDPRSALAPTLVAVILAIGCASARPSLAAPSPPPIEPALGEVRGPSPPPSVSSGRFGRPRMTAGLCPNSSTVSLSFRAGCESASVRALRAQPNSRLRRQLQRRLAFRTRVRNHISYVTTPSYSALTPAQQRLLRTLPQCSSTASSKACWDRTLSKVAKATFHMITHVLEHTDLMGQPVIFHVTTVEGLLAEPKTTHFHGLTGTTARVDGWRLHLMLDGVSEDALQTAGWRQWPLGAHRTHRAFGYTKDYRDWRDHEEWDGPFLQIVLNPEGTSSDSDLDKGRWSHRSSPKDIYQRFVERYPRGSRELTVR